MALKFRITKSQYEKLSEDFKAEYQADGDSHFKLDVSGIDDPAELRRAKERAEARAEELGETVTELETKVTTLEASQTKEGRDAQNIDKRWKTKYDRDIASKDEEIATRDNFIRESLVETAATALAVEISTVPALMSKTIKERLTVDFSGDKPKVAILGADGKPDPALTMTKLREEIVANKDYAPILVGNKATGGDAQRGRLPAGGATSATGKDVDVNSLSNDDFAARVRARKEGQAA